MSDDEWTSDNFRRRTVEVKPEAIPSSGQPTRIEIALIVNGVTLVRMQAREPGLVALVSRANDETLTIEVVEPAPARYRDMQDPPGGGRSEGPIESWHATLLGVTS